MTARRRVEIVGGGLAGLSLGLALQQAGVPSVVFEAGDYPRHRVCGEFIAGLKARTLETLGLSDLLSEAHRHRHVVWFRQERVIRRQTLASPALAISRNRLDAALATAYREAGGELLTQTRMNTQEAPPGRVFAEGRRRTTSPWLGLKAHVPGMTLGADLEFHLGDRAYVGLARVEGDVVNVCGLFHTRPGLPVTRSSALLAYLTDCGLAVLAERVQKAGVAPESCSAVAGLAFGELPPVDDRIRLGDAFAMIPPFTGNGMAMAFQSAETALAPLSRWSRGEMDWEQTSRVTSSEIHGRFQRRLRLACRLHPFLLSPAPQSLFDLAGRFGFLPLRRITQAVHD